MLHIYSSMSHIKHSDYRLVLLYRFHIVIILVNLIAVLLDTYKANYTNVLIELLVLLPLITNLWYLRYSEHTLKAAYSFLFITTVEMLSLIWANHFATLSILFVFLLPLTTMIFIGIRKTLIIEVFLMLWVGVMLYVERTQNASNPFVQHLEAFYTLVYAVVIIFLFAMLYHSSIFRTFEELEDVNRQKELLIKEVHHRVKNNLNLIASIVGLQANRSDRQERDDLLKTKTRIESIAMVHEMLYRYDDLENIEVVSYLKRLTSLLLQMYSAPEKIEIDIQSDVASLPLEQMIQLGMLTNELVTNSLKYAFKEDGEIRISLQRDEDHYLFRYADNGKGIASDKITEGKTLGIKLIRLAAKQLKADIETKNDQGLHYLIRFKI